MPTAPGFSIRALICLTGALSLPAVPAVGSELPTGEGAPAAPTAAPQPTASTPGAPGGAPAPSADQTGRENGAGGPAPGAKIPDAACLSRTVCAIKDKIRWGVPSWTPVQCDNVARAILKSAKRHDLSPTLLLAVMINESDLNEKAAHATMRDQVVYAKDTGLMGIRCVLDRQGRCANGNVRGVRWSDLATPETNIEQGAKELAYWRDGGATTTITVKVRDKDGHLRPGLKRIPCKHKDHAYWAHYNHGPRYITTGYPRHYPHRVAVLDHALATILNVDAPELRTRAITMRDPGRRPRTIDHPLEPRYKKLCDQIQSIPPCPTIAAHTTTLPSLASTGHN